MVIYFLRHGETDYNVKGYVQGITGQAGRCLSAQSGHFLQQGVQQPAAARTPHSRHSLGASGGQDCGRQPAS